LALLNLLPVASFIVYWLSGRRAMQVFSGENVWVDAFLVYPFWTVLVILVQLLPVFLVWDATGAVLRRVRKIDREAWRHRTHAFTVWVWIVISVYSIATIVVDTSSARIVELDIPLPPGAAGLDGIRILQISDVQGDGRTSEAKIRRFVEQVHALDPDLILNSGDLVTNGEKYIASTARLLGTMPSRYGHFATVGDHDIFSNKPMVVSALRANGIVVADDTSFTLTVRDAKVGLTLITYTYPQRPRTKVLDSLLETTVAPFRILLIHQPNEGLVRRAADAGYQLVLAGHTHGGGISFGLPGWGGLSPASFESPYVSGLYRVGDTWLNVTNGLGFTLAPIRFHAPLEMTLITLRAHGANGNPSKGGGR
ncbi:MAG: metallophosphoesterase, partial [Bacteroidota bacterium]